MASSDDQEIVSELLPFVQVYKNGRVVRFLESERVPPSLQDPKTGVSSEDIKFSTNPDISARLYIPSKFIATTEKLPILLFFHGGAFCIESAFSLYHQRYLNALVSQANVVAVSVEYRLAPEYPLPIAYEDCWTSLQRALAHDQSTNDGHRCTFAQDFNEEPWLKDNVDFNRVFLGGDSAGANISHNLAMRPAAENVIRGICLIHPYFWGSKPGLNWGTSKNNWGPLATGQKGHKIVIGGYHLSHFLKWLNYP
ncbi:2-hydroxyisoflavanone dehydratase-like [Papaver somniferum]|uniref:2-hydroxyisoflavanone dehydratase-like n=1 Tax=Papaver somniferum TaxID=3469 RepID=UPI000E6FC38E|nr:2-hydroxyisoflavanone dehydratase-like [Papaver somniferum]